MKVRARFLCHGVYKGVNYEEPELHPVYSSNKSAPNFQWSQATPSGTLKMQINNPACFGAFVAGQEYDILFTPARPTDEEIETLRQDIAEAEKLVEASPTRGDLKAGLDGKRLMLERALKLRSEA